MSNDSQQLSKTKHLIFGQVNVLVYTNWKGETETRHVIPTGLWFGSNIWHTEPQWIMDVYDLDKQALRAYALSGIKEVSR